MLSPQRIDVYTDTRDILAHAKKAALQRGLKDWFIVDVDAHHVETVSWAEIVEYIDDPVVREDAINFQKQRFGSPPYGLNGSYAGNWVMTGRDRRRIEAGDEACQNLSRRAIRHGRE